MMRHLLASVLLLLFLLGQLIAYQNSCSMQIELANNDESQIRDSIIIDSDEDFENQNWSGAGTQENPYILENIRIDSPAPCVNITGTRKHFIIRECSFWSRTSYYPLKSSKEATIIFSNISNGAIIGCVIEGGDNYDCVQLDISTNCRISNNIISAYPGWLSPSRELQSFRGDNGIYARDSSNCTLNHNTITKWKTAIYIHGSNSSIIFNNTVAENYMGLEIRWSNRNSVVNNSIISNSVGIEARGGQRNSIFGNRIGLNEIINAYDYTHANLWDDNISLGNAWDDYNGSGSYAIPSESDVVDRYPWICINFSYTILDYFGPVIIFYPWAFVTMTQAGPHETHSFIAKVNDSTGVDSVFVFYRFSTSGPFTCLELNFTPSERHPDSYSYILRMNDPYNIILYYYYWANDSLGNSRQAPIDRFHWHTYPDVIPDSWDEFAIIVVLTVGIIAILIIIYKKRR